MVQRLVFKRKYALFTRSSPKQTLLKARCLLTISLCLFVCLPLPLQVGDKRARGFTLSYDVCGGFGNQLLSSTYAATIAISLNFSELIVPQVLLDGTQEGGVDINRISATAEGFEKMFDREHLETFLALRGVKLLQAPVDIHSRHVCQNSESLERCLKKFLGKWRRRTLLHLECPFLKQLWAWALSNNIGTL